MPTAGPSHSSSLLLRPALRPNLRTLFLEDTEKVMKFGSRSPGLSTGLNGSRIARGGLGLSTASKKRRPALQVRQINLWKISPRRHILRSFKKISPCPVRKSAGWEIYRPLSKPKIS